MMLWVVLIARFEVIGNIVDVVVSVRATLP